MTQPTGDQLRAIIKAVGSFGTNHGDAPGEYVLAGWRAGVAATKAEYDPRLTAIEEQTAAIKIALSEKQPTLSDCSETLRLAVLANSTLAIGMVHGLYSLVKEPDPGPWAGFLKARLRAIKDMRDKGHSLEFIEATLNLQSPGHVERLLDANPDDPT